MNAGALHRRLLAWYGRSGRPFPWRRTRSPYRILVAEVMLQQTQASRVVPAWKKFLRKYPDVRSLAAATLSDVIRQWDGLGYNSRALRLHRCARIVVDQRGGRFPSSADELRRMPGVGRYTSAAVACFAFGVRVPVVDVNIRRVLTRISKRIRYTDDLISLEQAWEIAEGFIPAKRYYEWNQALMDLGATVCTSGVPGCQRCPLSRVCPSASAITGTGRRRRRVKAEPMFGQVPRRLVRGTIIRYLRGSGTIDAQTIARHVGEVWPGVMAVHVAEALRRLAGDGLVVLRGADPKKMRVSLP